MDVVLVEFEGGDVCVVEDFVVGVYLVVYVVGVGVVNLYIFQISILFFEEIYQVRRVGGMIDFDFEEVFGWIVDFIEVLLVCVWYGLQDGMVVVGV